MTLLNERYRPERSIEHGPLGEVFLAEDTTTGEWVVIRVLERHFEIAPEVLAAFVSDMDRLRALNLPTIAPYIDIFTHERCLHLVTPYLQGVTLEAYIEDHGPLDPRTFQTWAISLTRTLSAVHLEDLIHGDLRPSSIFLVSKTPPARPAPAEDAASAEGAAPTQDVAEPVAPEPPPAEPETPHPADLPGDSRLVIADFGLYRLLEGMRLSTTTARLSLSNYTSPQRWQGQRTRIDDDIWSLGILFFYMVSGKKPFEAPSDAAIMQRVLHAATPNLRGRVPRGLVAIIERTLEKDPWRRYRSLPALLVDLERGSVRWPGRRSGQFPRRSSPWVSWILFGLLMILLLGIPAGGGAAVMSLLQPTPTPVSIVGVVIPPTSTATQTPVVLPFQPPDGPPTETRTPSPTWTPVIITLTPTATFTPSDTPTITHTPSITPSRTSTPTSTATWTPSGTPTPTWTPTGTPPPTETPSFTPTEPPPPTPTPTASPTITATFTPTSTPTATANATATANYEAFLTRAAYIQGTQIALETRAASPPPDLTATSSALAPLAGTLAAQRFPRTAGSAVSLCDAGERIISFTDFTRAEAIPASLPAGFTVELIGGDSALHAARSADWAITVPGGYTRLRFDLLPPQANTPPLELRLGSSSPAETVAWQIHWAISDDPNRTGLVLERLENGVPVAISSLIPVSFGSWVTVELALTPLTPTRDAVLLRVYAGGEDTALLTAASGEFLALDSATFSASVDSAPWIDNLLICARTPVARP